MQANHQTMSPVTELRVRVGYTGYVGLTYNNNFFVISEFISVIFIIAKAILGYYFETLIDDTNFEKAWRTFRACRHFVMKPLNLTAIPDTKT